MRCHIGIPTHAPKRAVASSVATKLLYQRLSWSIDVLQELRCPPNPPRRELDQQPDQSKPPSPTSGNPYLPGIVVKPDRGGVLGDPTQNHQTGRLRRPRRPGPAADRLRTPLQPRRQTIRLAIHPR